MKKNVITYLLTLPFGTLGTVLMVICSGFIGSYESLHPCGVFSDFSHTVFGLFGSNLLLDVLFVNLVIFVFIKLFALVYKRIYAQNSKH